MFEKKTPRSELEFREARAERDEAQRQRDSCLRSCEEAWKRGQEQRRQIIAMGEEIGRLCQQFANWQAEGAGIIGTIKDIAQRYKDGYDLPGQPGYIPYKIDE